jgi:hypothetical protein
MIRTIARALIAALAGAAAGALCLTVAYARHATLTLDMDRELPRKVASGFYPIERAGETTFAWTARRADITLRGLSRSAEWTCAVTLRGGRSDPTGQPVVDIAVDGITAAAVPATNEFQEIRVAVPSRAGAGLVLSVTSSSTIVPGPSDPRELGVQIDRVICRPVGTASIRDTPRGVARDAALNAAVFGAAWALAGVTLGATLLAAVLMAVGQALPLSSGAAPYIGFSTWSSSFALWIALSTVLLIKGLEWARARPLDATARFVLLFSGAALYLKLLGLLHPSKLLVDAVFHAHRLEWVLAGRYFFTQPMPGGVSFPYAIGLYVFAAPWATLTRDHVTLLRVVVCAAEVVAGALLYPAMARAWGHRRAAATAVVLFNVVPLPYGLVGNANLTNAFGQSVALATLMVATRLPAARHNAGATIGLFSLCALAFLSHVSTFALLAVTLVALAFLYRWRGGPALSRTAWTILGVAIVAALFAVAVYYGHFADVYRTALRVRAEATANLPPAPPNLPESAIPGGVSLGGRVRNALAFTIAAVGWPILVLAALGIWRVWSERLRDRVVLLVAAWGIAYVAFLGVAVMRVDAPFQRYAAEFFGRVLLATYPAAVVLAGCGIGWALSRGMTGRVLSIVLAGWAVVLGLQHWRGWFT